MRSDPVDSREGEAQPVGSSQAGPEDSAGMGPGLAHIYRERVRRYGERVAMRYRREGGWVGIS